MSHNADLLSNILKRKLKYDNNRNAKNYLCKYVIINIFYFLLFLVTVIVIILHTQLHSHLSFPSLNFMLKYNPQSLTYANILTLFHLLLPFHFHCANHIPFLSSFKSSSFPRTIYIFSYPLSHFSPFLKKIEFFFLYLRSNS